MAGKVSEQSPTAVLDNLRRSVVLVTNKNTQKPDCGWAETGGPQVGSLTYNFLNPGQAIGDILIKLPFPVYKLWIASIANISRNNSYMFHFRPVGRVYNSNAVDETGAEAWIPLRGFTDPSYNNMLRFKKPITEFYLDVGFEDGGGSHLTTFMFSDESFDITYFPALAPSQ